MSEGAEQPGAVVRLEVDDRVATITLARPPMNAISGQLAAELSALAREVGVRSDVRAVILYGGPRLFAAGADFKEMAARPYAEMGAFATRLQETFEEVARIPKPVIAAVTGYALGGGLELALTADFRVLGDNARVGQPEILLGIIPGAGGTQRLPRLIGASRAKDLIYSGRHVRADEALAIGLADRVVAADEVYAAARDWARTFVDGPAVALRAAKQAVDVGLGLGLPDALRLETALFAGLFGTEDQRSGMASFAEKGPGQAQFSGS